MRTPGPTSLLQRRWSWFVAALLGACLAGAVAAMAMRYRSATSLPASAQDASPVAVQYTQPGEFEPQEALLFAWETRETLPGPAENQRLQHDVLSRMAAAVWQQIRIVFAVADADAEADARQSLQAAGVPEGVAEFVRVPLNSLWIRDFGPVSVRGRDGQPAWIDAVYSFSPFLGSRPLDDAAPSRLGEFYGLPTLSPPFASSGGLLLTNGQGLAVSTRVLAAMNRDEQGLERPSLERLLRQYLGITRVVYLEPLHGENTGHVDLFATFTAADTVVLGQASEQDDPINAAILDLNAVRLAEVDTPAGPLKIVRIPMPPRTADVGGASYTNVVFANGVLLVPTYPGIAPDREAAAFEIYQRLLPDWKLIGIDSRDLIVNRGALHCATMNVWRLPDSPSNPSARRRLRYLRPEAREVFDR
jgi:agmatine/peptidylarginine deiminase